MQRPHRTSNIRRSRVSGLRIAVLAALAAVAASGSCTIDGGVTRCEQTGLHCPPGWVCSADQDVCIRAGSCGNGIVNDGETCDDGNNQSRDGCSSDCASDESCGNDILDVAVGEICDDGGRIDGDGCSADCESEACGNQTVDRGAGEECDTGPGDSFGCNFDCSFRRCGDGYVNKAAEDCDVTEADGDCDDDCTDPECGDKNVNTSFVVYTPPPGEGEQQTEECDAGDNTAICNGHDNDNSTTAKGKGNCQKPACGDGYRNPEFKARGTEGKLEACDDGENRQECNGNDNDNDVSKGLGDCQVPKCGDGYFNPKFTPPGSTKPEQCDTGGNKDSCNGTDKATTDAGNCQKPACGDGYVNDKFSPSGPTGPVEACDAGVVDMPNCNGNGPGADAAKCQIPTCGDGYTNSAFPPPGNGGLPEECDTGAVGNTDQCNGNGDSNGGKCREPFCGDGYFNPAAGERCDFTAPDPHDPCAQGQQCVPGECICD